MGRSSTLYLAGACEGEGRPMPSPTCLCRCACGRLGCGLRAARTAFPLGPRPFRKQAVRRPHRPAGQVERPEQHQGSQRPCCPSEPGCSIITSALEGLSLLAVSSSCPAHLASVRTATRAGSVWPRLPAGSGSQIADHFCSCHQCLVVLKLGPGTRASSSATWAESGGPCGQ